MTIHYAYFCICGNSHREAVDICLECGSDDIERAPCFAQVEYDDARDDARMREIRANREVDMERGRKLLEEVERIAEVARGSYEPPAYQPGFLLRKQSA